MILKRYLNKDGVCSLKYVYICQCSANDLNTSTIPQLKILIDIYWRHSEVFTSLYLKHFKLKTRQCLWKTTRSSVPCGTVYQRKTGVQLVRINALNC